MSAEDKLQQASVEFQKLQADLSRVVEARQRLDAQFSENELVKKVHALRDFTLNYHIEVCSQGIRAINAQKQRVQAYWTCSSEAGPG